MASLGSLCQRLTNLKSRYEQTAFLLGESLREGSSSKSPQVVGRLYFWVAVGVVASCFFTASSREKGGSFASLPLHSLLRDLLDWVRPTVLTLLVN